MLSLLSQYIHASGAAGLLWLYLVLHLCVGLLLPYRQGAKPYFFMLMERAGLDLERRLNRETRPQFARQVRGIVVALVLGALGYLAGYDIAQAGKMAHGWVVELAFLSLCIHFMSPLKLLRQVTRHLHKNELQKAAQAVQLYIEEPLAKADTHTVIRKAVEFTAVSLNQFLAAPAFWFLLAGASGLSVYVTFAALHQAFGLPDERRKYFGRGVRVVNTLLSIVPGLLTTVLLAVSALFVSKSSPLRAFSTVLQQAVRYDSLYMGGGLMAAMAGGLGVTLGGPVRYSSDYAVERPWIGPKGSSARLTAEDLARAAMLQYAFFVCFIGLLSVLIILNNIKQ